MFTAPYTSNKTTTTDKKKDFDPTLLIERQYTNKLMAIAADIEKILSSVNPANLIDALQRYSQGISDYVTNASGALVYSLNNQSRKQWEKQSSKISRGMINAITTAPLEPLMQQYIAENVALIHSMPLDTAKKVYLLLLQQSTEGGRAANLIPQIQKIGRINKNRAAVIARTETSKISTDLTRARAAVLGLSWYVWRTSHDVRVRNSHSIMDRVLIDWNNPPSPEQLAGKKSKLGYYHAGKCPNCFIDSQIPIYTSKGWKKIGDIEKGDLVLTHKGRFRKVNEILRKNKQYPSMVDILIKGNKGAKGKTLTVTDNHLLLVNNQWIPAKDVKEGDGIKFLSSNCTRCGKPIRYDQKYCSQRCISLDVTDKEWASEEHRLDMSEKISKKNKEQYLNGERDRFEQKGEYKFMDAQVVSVRHWEVKKGKTLYNFSVEDDESYIAKGFVVHNCRCYPQPIIDIEDVNWPCKVYTGGRIVTMTRPKFEKLAA